MRLMEGPGHYCTIIIYGLFSVAILASVFDNPVKHPELSFCYKRFQNELNREEETTTMAKHI